MHCNTPQKPNATHKHIANARASVLEARLVLLELLASATDDANMFVVDRLLAVNSELQCAFYELDCFATAGAE